MKTKINPVIVGSFVIGAVVLLVGALLTIRSLAIFSPTGHFVACFNESVPGLGAGSVVKLRGVTVGRVTQIRVEYDARVRQSLVVVVAELTENVVNDPAGQPIRLTDRAAFQTLIGEGLRAQIALAGITGQQFVELDFFDPAQFPPPVPTRQAEYPTVPTQRSGISELVANVSKVVGSLNKIDFAGIAREINALVAAVKQQAGGLDLPKMVTAVTGAAAALDGLASSAAAQAAFANLNHTAAAVQDLVAKLDRQVDPVSAELVRSLRAFHDAAQSVQTLLGRSGGLGDETAKTLRQLTQAAASLQALADFLERNPNALLTGKKLPADQP